MTVETLSDGVQIVQADCYDLLDGWPSDAALTFLKPLALMAFCLNYCGVGKDQLVIDPFMGSGTLGIACHRAGIPYLGVEIDSAYYQVAKDRLLAEVSQGMLPLTVAS